MDAVLFPHSEIGVSTYQRILDQHTSGLITLDEMHWELFRTSAKLFSSATSKTEED